MTALADQITGLGYYPSSVIADLAITAGQVYKDGNSQIRVAGSATAIQPAVDAAGQVAALTVVQTAPGHKGSGNNKW
jgi:hypothetical protein